MLAFRFTPAAYGSTPKGVFVTPFSLEENGVTRQKNLNICPAFAQGPLVALAILSEGMVWG